MNTWDWFHEKKYNTYRAIIKPFFSVKSKYIQYSIWYSKIDGNLSSLVIFLLLGSIGQICHVQKVNHLLHLIDPNTCQGMFRTIFRLLATSAIQLKKS